VEVKTRHPGGFIGRFDSALPYVQLVKAGNCDIVAHLTYHWQNPDMSQISKIRLLFWRLDKMNLHLLKEKRGSVHIYELVDCDLIHIDTVPEAQVRQRIKDYCEECGVNSPDEIHRFDEYK